jgi:hypothetical protein
LLNLVKVTLTNTCSQILDVTYRLAHAVGASARAGDDVFGPLHHHIVTQDGLKDFYFLCAQPGTRHGGRADGTMVFEKENRSVALRLRTGHVPFVSPYGRQGLHPSLDRQLTPRHPFAIGRNLIAGSKLKQPRQPRFPEGVADRRELSVSSA